MSRRSLRLILVPALLLALACGGESSEPAAPAPQAAAPPAEPTASSAPADLPNGLLLALSQFEVSPQGKVLPKPKEARLEILTRRGGEWDVEVLEDADSNVFHKAMVYDGAGGPAILTLGGTGAFLKLWRRDGEGFSSETVWTKDFGGKFSRMRDAEAGDLLGDGRSVLAVATHDQGVVAIVVPKEGGGFEVRELDQEKDTFVHEVEIGDLDSDGVLEFYTTPSEPNRLDGTPQPGKVTRYIPSKNEGRTVVADLGDRHAKEILVADVDGDGIDELYVSVEEPVEIRRYEADTDPKQGAVIAILDDRLTRFLTAGDVDGDGKREMVAAGFKSGLWLLRPGDDPNEKWEISSIDRQSSGFEHASILADLDGDGVDELYVASDDQGEVRRYTWNGSGFDREVIHRRDVPGSVFTWNIMPVPVELLK